MSLVPGDYDRGFNDGYNSAKAELSAENERLREALTEIAEGKGRYSTDRLEHANNTIEDMKKLAHAALCEQGKGPAAGWYPSRHDQHGADT
jgi:hypothetical protein